MQNSPREHSAILSTCIVLHNAQREHSAILSTCIKLPSLFKTIILSGFECSLKTSFTACCIPWIPLSFSFGCSLTVTCTEEGGFVVLCVGASEGSTGSGPFVDIP